MLGRAFEFGETERFWEKMAMYTALDKVWFLCYKEDIRNSSGVRKESKKCSYKNQYKARQS
jgi:hypothetical protein